MAETVYGETRAAGYQLLSRFRGELMGLALLWVMLFHAYEFHFGVALLDAFKALGFGGVDIFFLLSGLGLYTTLSKRGPLSKYVTRRLSRILPAYWLVVGIYSLWLRAGGRISFQTMAWSMSTLHYWFHIPKSFNWYIPALLAFYFLAPAYARLLERCRYKEWLTAAMFPVSYGLYRLSIPLGLNYLEDFINRIPAVAMGFLAGYYILSGKKLTWRHKLVWGCLALAGVAVGLLRLRGALYISLCFVLAAVLMPLCLGLGKLLSLLPGRLHRGLALLGDCSLEIYLLNVVVTREFATLAPWLDWDTRHLCYYAVVYTLNILLGILLHRGIETVRKRLSRRKLPPAGA